MKSEYKIPHPQDFGQLQFLPWQGILDVRKESALAGVVQSIEWWLANQRVASSIPSLEHMPGLQARSPVGGAQEATTH